MINNCNYVACVMVIMVLIITFYIRLPSSWVSTWVSANQTSDTSPCHPWPAWYVFRQE